MRAESKQASERIDELRVTVLGAMLRDVLSHFTEESRGPGGYPAIRRDWVPASRVEEWRQALAHYGFEVQR